MELSQRIFWVATGLWLLLSFWLFFHGADFGFWMIVVLVLILYTLSGVTYSRARKKEQAQARLAEIKKAVPVEQEVKVEPPKEMPPQ
jgi:uncharacterized membrane protein